MISYEMHKQKKTERAQLNFPIALKYDSPNRTIPIPTMINISKTQIENDEQTKAEINIEKNNNHCLFFRNGNVYYWLRFDYINKKLIILQLFEYNK